MNQFQGIGNLSKDVDSRFTPNGKQVATFTVCCDSGYGENKHTEFVKCVAWGKTAEVAEKYLSKGSKVFIQGPMKTRKWADKDGNDRYTSEVTVLELTMLSPRGDSADRYEPQTMPDIEDTPF